MLKENSFYNVTDCEYTQSALNCIVVFNAAHEIFSGHFPVNPIVPGVCTMAIVKELLENALQQKLVLQEATVVKFLGLISPYMSPTLNLSWKEESGQYVASASLQDGATSLFKMSGSYIPAKQ